MTTELTTTTGTQVPPTVVMPTPYDNALSLMPALLFIGAVLAIIKGWGWVTDRRDKNIQNSTVIESRLDELEKSSKSIKANTDKLNNHETRITVIETNNTHINTTLGELKEGIRQLNDNVLDMVKGRPHKEG
jgi:septal ring factor EnvC (AmiA/AmiB activator)